MPDEIVDYAIKDNEQYFEIRLATKRGVRKTKVKKKGFEKKYKKLKRKEETYGKRIKVYNRLTNKTTERVITRRSDYIYNPEHKAYERYNPEYRTKIQTENETKDVSFEQLRYLYKRQGSQYKRAELSARVPYKKPKVVSSASGQTLARSYQIMIKRHVVIDGQEHEVIGYSKVQRGDYTMEEMLEQARRHMKADIINRGGKYDYENVQFINEEKEEYVKWVYGNGNHG